MMAACLHCLVPRSELQRKHRFRLEFSPWSKSDLDPDYGAPGEKLLESVIAVAEELSFSRAARKVRVGQPTISRNVSEIEKELGFRLFERNGKTVKLTDAGRAFLEEARTVI